jgi:hypothetical protein
VNISRGKRQRLEAGVGGGNLSRRGILGGLVTVPVLYGIGSATTAVAATATQPGKATDGLVRGVERRFNAPQLAKGTRLVLPAGIKAVPIQPPPGSSWPTRRSHATKSTRCSTSVTRTGRLVARLDPARREH